MERGYNEKMIRKLILGPREHSRNDLSEREKQQISEKKLIFNATYYPVFQYVRSKNGKLLAPTKEHMKSIS